MIRSITYLAMAEFLQSTSATRPIEFRDGGFFRDDDEVTGQKFIVDLPNLNFGSVTRQENRTVSVLQGKPLWSSSLNDRRSVSERMAGARVEQPLILRLVHYETGALFNLVLEGPDGRAAVGRLCNLYGRHPGNADAIVQLTTCRQRGATGYLIKAPELTVVAWEPCYPSSDFGDDLPF